MTGQQEGLPSHLPAAPSRASRYGERGPAKLNNNVIITDREPFVARAHACACVCCPCVSGKRSEGSTLAGHWTDGKLN